MAFPGIVTPSPKTPVIYVGATALRTAVRPNKFTPPLKMMGLVPLTVRELLAVWPKPKSRHWPG